MKRCAAALLCLLALVLCLAPIPGCAFAHLIGGMAQNAEYQKLMEVPALYAELEDKKVAVLVNADRTILYQFPQLVEQITAGVTLRIGRDVPGVRVMRPDMIIAWQWRTPQWNAMSYGDMAKELGVDRVVLIDILEYRLNPPGNRWLWEGVCTASVNVIEADGFDPDMFADSFDVTSTFPNLTGVDRSAANARQIETGLLAQFVKEVAWLFYLHLEPKYPDKYIPDGTLPT